MPRKSSTMNLLNIQFEAVLIIILILVAILMIIFLNRRLGNGRLQLNNGRLQQPNGRLQQPNGRLQQPNGRLQLNNANNANNVNNVNNVNNFNNANNGAEELLESFNNNESHAHVFYANWCGHSRKYLENHHDNLLAMLRERNLHNRFTHSDVETEAGRALANRAKVMFLPSFYTEKNGEFTKFEFSNGINPEEIVEWLESN